MEFQLTKDSSKNTTFVDASGRVVYSTDTPMTLKGEITTVCRQGKDGVLQEIAQIHWHCWRHPELMYGGQTYDIKDFLKSSWRRTGKTFSGPDGHNYTWKIHWTKEELQSDTGQTVATYKFRNLIKRNKPMFYVENSVVNMLDLVILTWVYVEGERQQIAEAAAAGTA